MIRQSGQWLLAAKYCGQGYTKARTSTYAALEKRVEQLMINSIKERMSDLNNTQEI